ncbi:hypothetical protein EDC04DRAFT_2960670 [Pisolithus marmoratus]|nr:hypothetical protein EDC04DRAFT_2960670 [Pisolithus marmoratus]
MTSSEILEDKFPEAVAAHTVRLAVPNHSDTEDLPIIVHDNVVSPVSMSEAENEHNDERSWTKVVRKKLREQCTTGKLRPDQEKVIREAERQLTLDERECIQRWSLSKTQINHEVLMSKGDEPPRDRKGKGPDPKDWGTLSMSEDELNPEAQRAALASWNATQRLARDSNDNRVGPSKSKLQREIAEPDKSDHQCSTIVCAEHHKKEKCKHNKELTRKALKSRDTPPNPVKDLVDKATCRDHKCHERQRTPRAMEPVKQINPKSYIGLAFKCLKRDEKKIQKPKRRSHRPKYSSSSESPDSSSDSSDESSETSNPDSSSSDDLYSSSSDSSSSRDSSSDDLSSATSNSDLMSSGSSGKGHRRQGRLRSHRKRSRGSHKTKKKSKSRHRTTLKPIPPTKYNGSDNIQVFQRFVMEGTAYVKDRRVASKKCVFILSHYLTKKAHEFYVCEVSGDPYKWQLSDFFMELFNYCFPVNFCLLQREKLKSCYQNSKTVKEYLHNLNELWNMIGKRDERTKVHKFWSGLWKDLQHDLWKEKLNPEISSLKKVAATAEILEIAQSITGDSSRKSQRPNNKKWDTGNDNALPKEDSSSKHWQKHHHRRKDRRHGRHKEAALSGNSQHQKKDRNPDKRKADPPKLSKDKQERHKAEGLCYICHKSGHFSRNCPE